MLSIDYRAAVAVALGALVVVGGIIGYQLYEGNRELTLVLQEYSRRVPVVLPEDSTARDEVEQQVNSVRNEIAQGQLARARALLVKLGAGAGSSRPPRPRRLEKPLELPGLGRPEGGEELPPSLEHLPKKVRDFFRQHSELREQFVACFLEASRRRGAGRDVGEVRRLLREVLHAAELGDEQRVGETLRRAGRALGAHVPPELPPGKRKQLLAAVERFERAYERKRRQGMDVRRATKLFRQAEAAIDEEQPERALKLFAEAMDELKRAKPVKGRAARRHRGLRPPGQGEPQMRFLTGVLDAVLREMAFEDKALGSIQADIDNAKTALREKNQSQIREILSTAVEKFRMIGHRRNRLAAKLNEPPRVEPGRRGAHGQGEKPEPRRRHPEPTLAGGLRLSRSQAREALLDAFAELKRAPADDFDIKGAQLCEDLLAVLYPVPDEAALQEQVDRALPPVEALPGQEVTELDALRGFDVLEPPYRALRKANVDLTEVDETLQQAREALMGHAYADCYDRLRSALLLIAKLMPEVGPRLPRKSQEAVLQTPRPPSRAQEQPAKEQPTGGGTKGLQDQQAPDQ